MKLKLLFLLIISVIFTNAAFAQKAKKVKLPTAKTLINNYIKAMGGKAAIQRQTSRQMKGTMEMSPMGLKGTTEIWTAAPNKSFSKSNIAGIGEIVEGFDGTTAWSNNPIQGSREKKGDELLQTLLMSDFYRDLNFEKNYPKMTVRGLEKLRDKDVYVIIATPKGLAPETLYFDKMTGLLIRQDTSYISPEGTLVLQTTIDDYREVDGIRVAHKIIVKNPQFEVITIFTEIKHGATVDETIFTRPN